MRQINRKQRNKYEQDIQSGVPIVKRVETIRRGNDIFQRVYYNEEEYYEAWIDTIAIYELHILLDAYAEYRNEACLQRIYETVKLFDVQGIDSLREEIDALPETELTDYKFQRNWSAYNRPDGTYETYIDENGEEKYSYDYEDPWDDFYQ